MKYNRLKWLSFITVVALIMNIFPSISKAEENILPFDTDVEGYLVKNDAIDIYTIKVPSAGNVGLKLTSYVADSAYIKLYDEDNNTVFEDYVDGNEQNPGKYSNNIDLEAGTYYVKIYDKYGSDDTGKYILKASFTSAQNIESEPNGGTENANSLAFNNEVRGFLSWNDSADTYKITVPKAGEVSVDLASYVNDTAYIILMDDYNNTIIEDNVNGSSVNPGKYYNSVDLEAGTYFIKIYDKYDSDNTGVYTLKTEFAPANNNEVEPSNGIVEAQPIQFYQKINGFLSWNDSVDVYKITLPKSSSVGVSLSSYVSDYTYIQLLDNQNNDLFTDSVNGSSKNPGKYTNNVDLKAGTYYIKIYDKYDSDNTGKYHLMVTAKYLLPSLTINKVKTISTKVTGKTEKNANVTVRVGGKKYQKKASSSGNFSFTIGKQKVGTKIYISVKGKYGTSSKTIKVIK